jgi:hypothetical protein
MSALAGLRVFLVWKRANLNIIHGVRISTNGGLGNTVQPGSTSMPDYFA